MNELFNEGKRGIKLTIIDEQDYADLKEVLDAIVKLGYKVSCVSNGNFVCERAEEK